MEGATAKPALTEEMRATTKELHTVADKYAAALLGSLGKPPWA